VAFIALTPARTLAHAWLNYFFRHAERLGLLSPDWYLTSVNFGSEMLPLWNPDGTESGTGFAVKSISLTGLPTVA
jgi:hypothetical protein